MDNAHSQTVSLIWNIADDVLRDVFVRGQYRDVILPMVVLRRLDALLEPTKAEVDAQVASDKELGLEPDEYAISAITGLSYYNTSRWTLSRIKSQAPDNNELLLSNFTEYLLGFSKNVYDVLNKFEFFAKARKLADRDCLLPLIEKITDPYINLTDKPAKDPNGLPLPAVTNYDMGMIFEELLRRFNEENNEEAGEHFTPRDVIHLLSKIVFDPVLDNLPPVVQIYDPACGSGGMLTEASEYLVKNGVPRENILIAGTEINPETYAICKSDLIIKSVNPDGIYCGNTITDNHFSDRTFGYMITNPPYGKSWKEHKKQIYHEKELHDERFRKTLVQFDGTEAAVDCCPRTSDGQLLFVLEMIDRMKPLDVQPQGTRIASIHNGSSLFTGDAGQAESDIRRYLVENDLVEAIIQLPNNIFYNTGISTYCWILTNNKEERRRGKVQLIDASQAYDKLRKNQGNRNCTIENFSSGIYDVYHFFVECEATDDAPIASKIFDGDEFRYNSVTIERPLRLRAQFSPQAIEDMLFDPKQLELTRWLYSTYGERVFEDLTADVQDIREYLQDQEIKITDKNFKKFIDPSTWKARRDFQQVAEKLAVEIGTEVFMDYNQFLSLASETSKRLHLDIKAADLDKKICRVMAVTDPEAAPVIAKKVKATSKDVTTLTDVYGVDSGKLADYGLYVQPKGKEYIIYESDSDLRDSEKIPVNEDIHEYFLREVKPYAPDAWINLPATKIGCEISFNKYFYEPKPLRSLEENEADILALDKESQGLIRSLLNHAD
ncbi:MAG: type I restriction-modification system subunit M [Muribaculum sp.]|nr:type I restriction-modification system subunit M [Muribaculum sp.]